MSLKSRVEKAKKLVINSFSGTFSTWGTGYLNYYYIVLTHKKEEIITPDGKKVIMVFVADCQRQHKGEMQQCPGNKRHTVCYHSLGAIYNSFKEAGKLVSFFETYESASRMKFGGKIAKIKSSNGNGFVWCVVKDWPAAKTILSAEKNINLMRGSDDDEAID